MTNLLRLFNFTLAALFVLIWSSVVQPAQARNNTKKIIGGIAIGVGFIAEAVRRGTSTKRSKNRVKKRTRKSRSKRRTTKGRKNDKSKVDSKEAALKAEKEQQERANRLNARKVVRGNRGEDDLRNVDYQINDFMRHLSLLESEARKLDAYNNNNTMQVGRSTQLHITNVSRNEITVAAVRELLDQVASDHLGLQEFHKINGDMWTTDRIKVQILLRAKRFVIPHYKGVGARGPSPRKLNAIFRKATDEVYLRALESSETVGIGHSYNRLVRVMFERSITGMEKSFEGLAQGFFADMREENTSAFNFSNSFRTRRILYDCVADGIVSDFQDIRQSSDQGQFIKAKFLPKNSTSAEEGEQVSADPVMDQTDVEPVESAKINDEDPYSWTNIKTYVEKRCAPMMQRVASTKVMPVSIRTEDWESVLEDSKQRLIPAGLNE